MNQPSTPTRPRQAANGPPRRTSTRNRRVTRSVSALQNNQPQSSSLSPPPEQPEQGGANDGTVPADDNLPPIEPVAAVTSTLIPQAPSQNTSTPKKRRTPAEDDDDPNIGPLLSEYMCPICLSPPSSAIVTLCGHIMCGSCLHGALTARGAPVQKLCPVCRTPIPNVQFTRAQTGNSTPAPAAPPAPRPPVLQPRMTRNGVALPTAANDMLLVREHMPEVIDVDVDMDEPPRVEPRWDPARSGVVGLEVLTLGVDEVM
ncbi:unnamed protein product [Rhizoctonia solani]|uniref:RING-type domain-containing protein n=1 Tax=Rhizoctonia solani TaxID=456999 RepID=A0A8H3APQ9_9AGAM|nr:unnamed protein product [Rhizoctonia solani]